MVAAVAFLSVFTLAVCFITIGAVSVELKLALGIGNEEIGNLTFVFFLTCMFVQLLVGPLVDRFGHKRMAITGFLCTGVSLFLFAGGTALGVVQAAAVLLGVGAICCNTVGNTLLPVVLFGGREPARASNLGNGFVGLAFVLIPLLVVTMTGVGWRYSLTLSVIGAVVLGFALVAAIPAYPAVSTGFRWPMAWQLLRQPAVLVAALAMVCYLGVELTIGTWTRTLVTDLGGGPNNPIAVRDAGRILSLFGLAMALGRFASSTIRNLTRIGTYVVAGCSAAAIFGMFALGRASTPFAAAVAVALIGLALAPMFATLVGVTFSKYNPQVYGSIFGIVFSIGLIGPVFLPRLIGSLSVGRSVQQNLPVVMAAAAMLLVLALVMGRTKGRPVESPEPKPARAAHAGR